MAEGTLVFSASPGSKPTRSRTQARERQDVQAGDDDGHPGRGHARRGTSIELALPRSVLYTIRDVKFMDAAGKPLEADRTSRGYMNDDASIGYRIKGAGRR